LAEILYFESNKEFVEVQKDAGIIDYTEHVEKVLMIFLSNRGLMGRIVHRKQFPSKELAETLRKSENELKTLRKPKFLTINFEDKAISNSIKTIYNNLCKTKKAICR